MFQFLTKNILKTRAAQSISDQAESVSMAFFSGKKEKVLFFVLFLRIDNFQQ
jgi:hypothetical protein